MGSLGSEYTLTTHSYPPPGFLHSFYGPSNGHLEEVETNKWLFSFLIVSIMVSGSLSCCRSQCHLVAFLSGGVVAVGVGEMDVTRCDFHHLFDVSASFPNDVGVLCVGHVHL